MLFKEDSQVPQGSWEGGSRGLSGIFLLGVVLGEVSEIPGVPEGAARITESVSEKKHMVTLVLIWF